MSTAWSQRRFVVLGFFAALMFMCGCATAHRHLTDSAAVSGRPFVACNSNGCATVQNMEVPGAEPGTTAQLTSVGCAVHTLATVGHVAWECRNVKTTRGRWIWHLGKDPRVNSWTDKDWELSARYYGKPYLEAPHGWHWVCWNMPSERCYVDKDVK
ncbi:MAG: hypothetical protein ACJ71W_21985 [Terriglobales bacterium]